jgi:peptidoglycan/LPS O-acetylase OafA/YrhL
VASYRARHGRRAQEYRDHVAPSSRLWTLGRPAVTRTADSGPMESLLPDPSDPPSRSLGQVDAFDGMRGVAVLIVFVAHMNVLLPIPRLLVVPGATVSLDSFFVLSGFLITTLLLNEQSRRGKVKVSNFYARRVLRLLPALYVVVLVTALFAWATNTWMHTETASIFSVLFYYSNYYSASAPGIFSPRLASGFQHLWSLSFEEQFYLVWPWVTIFVLTVRRSLRTVVIILLGLIVLIGVHRAISFESGVHWWALFQRTDTRADSILWGTLLAHIWVRRKEPTRGLQVAAWLATAFLLVCLPLATEDSSFLYLGGFDLIDVACAILLLAILDGKWGGKWLFSLRPFIALGAVSYGFYLWHLPVFFAVRFFDPHWDDVVRVVVAVGVTLTLTLTSWFVLERPLMRWRKRLEAKRIAPATASAPAPIPAPVEPAPG